MQLDRSGGIAAEPNVTSMIDVLLVLVIIAMILLQVRYIFPLNVPALQSGSGAREPAIVLEVAADGGYVINGSGVSEARLEPRLRALFVRRQRKLLFVKSAGERTYSDFTHAIDVARSAGVEVIGYMP